MRSFVPAGLILISILLVLAFGGSALAEKVGMTMNMTTPVNTTTPVSTTTPMNMNMSMPMPMSMPMSMPMEMPNKMANGSMSMVMLQNVTLNVILIQNLTEVNMIIPTSINATNGNKTNSLSAVKPFV